MITVRTSYCVGVVSCDLHSLKRTYLVNILFTISNDTSMYPFTYDTQSGALSICRLCFSSNWIWINMGDIRTSSERFTSCQCWLGNVFPFLVVDPGSAVLIPNDVSTTWDQQKIRNRAKNQWLFCRRLFRNNLRDWHFPHIQTSFGPFEAMSRFSQNFSTIDGIQGTW